MPYDPAFIPAEEALFFGAAFAHIAAHNEHLRQCRRDRQARDMIRRGGVRGYRMTVA